MNDEWWNHKHWSPDMVLNVQSACAVQVYVIASKLRNLCRVSGSGDCGSGDIMSCHLSPCVILCTHIVWWQDMPWWVSWCGQRRCSHHSKYVSHWWTARLPTTEWSLVSSHLQWHLHLQLVAVALQYLVCSTAAVSAMFTVGCQFINFRCTDIRLIWFG